MVETTKREESTHANETVHHHRARRNNVANAYAGAATTTWSYEKTSIVVNDTQASTPYRIVLNGTTYMPIYYVDTLLQSLGFAATWNGTQHI